MTFAVLPEAISIEQLGGNVDEFAPQNPVGTHPAIIVGGRLELLKDKQGSGKTILELQIIDGPHKGHRGEIAFLTHYNEGDNSAKVREIAKKGLYRVAMCVGHNGPLSRLDVLGNKPLLLEFALQKGENGTEKGYTEFVRPYTIDGRKPYSSRDSGQPPQQSAQQPVVNPQAQGGNPFGGPAVTQQPQAGAMPWQGGEQPAQQPQGGNPFGGQGTAGSATNPFAAAQQPQQGGNPFASGGNPFGG